MDMEHSIAEGSFICGSPETVVEQIEKIANEAGADTFLGEFTFGELTRNRRSTRSGSSPSKSCRSLESSRSTR
jgi:alkanesulfonate monooxygenase SsuD/methylene tetrahydromethanopterin reductase-like flavin-dependent oxidoreductase (luciferase family)